MFTVSPYVCRKKVGHRNTPKKYENTITWNFVVCVAIEFFLAGYTSLLHINDVSK